MDFASKPRARASCSQSARRSHSFRFQFAFSSPPERRPEAGEAFFRRNFPIDRIARANTNYLLRPAITPTAAYETMPAPENDDRFAPREFGDRFSRFETESGRTADNRSGSNRPPDRHGVSTGPHAPSPVQHGEEPAEWKVPPGPDSQPRSNIRGKGSRPARGFWQSLLSFEGRATRGQYWAVYLIGLVVMLLPYAASIAPLLLSGPGGAPAPAETEAATAVENLSLLLWVPLALAFALFYCAVTVRRYHDRDKSGLWILLLFVPIASVAVMIECGFLPGTVGPNQYGADPRESQAIGTAGRAARAP